MMQRNMGEAEALRSAYAALQSGAFAQARDASAPWRRAPAGALLHALGQAGAGDVAGGAAALVAVARSNPGARHPAHDLVDLLQRHGRAGAAEHLRAALRHMPEDAGLLARLGAELAQAGPAEEAIAIFHRVAAVRPDAAAFSNLGKALAAAGRHDEAEAAFARATGLAPSDAQLGLNHAVARLKAGRMADGWPLFRARSRLPGRAPPPPGPELRGLDGVAGRTILLLHDEGLGDTLQFIRYAGLLERRGARVVAHVPPPLARLLGGNGVAVAGGALPAYDAWARLPDLPGVFGTTLAEVPAALPYLRADAGLARAWAARLPAGRRVGLAWAGASRAHDPVAAATDRIRSVPPGALGPLLAAPGITWVSLQYGTAAPAGVFDPMPGVVDFADTAAIVAGLEAVVSVDTSVAHLAGAMGWPVLLLDRYDACWRWLHGREDSPWYPGAVRIVRQAAPGDWDGVLRRAAAMLAGGVRREGEAAGRGQGSP